MTARRSPGELENDMINATGSNTSRSDSEEDQMSMEEQIGYVVLMSACIGVTVIGNILVILSVFTYRPLRNVQNFYIVSLACADLAVALIVMPFNVVTFVLDGRWVFGEIFCNIWLTSDILTCTASILNLCGIAVDRYCAIHDPIAYCQRRTVSRVMVNIAVIWTVSAVISVPPLIGWNNRAGKSLYDDETQACQLTDDRGFVIYSASGSFYIPLCLMTFVYVKIFLATRARLRARASAAATLSLTAQPSVMAASTCGSDQTEYNQPGGTGRRNGSADSSRDGEHSEENAEGYRAGRYDDLSGDVDRVEGDRDLGESAREEQVTEQTSSEDAMLSDRFVNSPVNGRPANISNECPRLKESNEKTNSTTNRTSSPRVDTASTTRETHFKMLSPEKKHTPSKFIHFDPVQTEPKIQSLKERRVPSSSKKRLLSKKLSTNSAETQYTERSVKPKRTFSDRFEWAISRKEVGSRTEDSGYRKKTNFTGSQNRESSKSLKLALKSRFDRAAPIDRTPNSFHDRPSDALTRCSSQYLTVPRSPADPSPLHTRSNASLRHHRNGKDDSSRFKFSVVMRRISRDSRKPGIDGSQRKDFWSEKQRISLAKERRVARTMAIIMAAFVVCWLPFFLMYVIFPFCELCVENVDQRLVNFIVWLGYVNSTLNPIIYTIFNVDFRRAFAALLRGKRCTATSSITSSTSSRR